MLWDLVQVGDRGEEGEGGVGEAVAQRLIEVDAVKEITGRRWEIVHGLVAFVTECKQGGDPFLG